jgi:gliding motility-associated-like protein
MKKLLLLAFSLFSFLSHGQVYIMSAVNNQTITTCSGTFYDSGGPTGNYLSSEVYTVTFCPATVGGFIRLNFTSFNVGPGDQMEVFDGPSTASPSYGVLNTTINPVGMILGASILNATGCITIRWTSNGSSSGWVAAVSCGLPCQVTNASLLSSIPPFSVDSGIYYIDICPGDSITLTGTGLYPNNNQYYHQSDSTSFFYWDFGNTKKDSGQTVSVLYDSIRGYNIRLKILDTLGCMNSNVPEIRVRVSTRPHFNGTTVSNRVICSGETSVLTGKVNPRKWKANSSLNTAGTTYLPDGSGASYTSTLVFTSFAPGQVLTNANHFLGICANIEHSYLGDLNITLTCPTSQTVTLKSYPGGTSTYLGEPIDDTNGGGPGLGYDYCWRPNGTTTMLGAANFYYHSFTDVAMTYYPNAAYIPPSTVFPIASTASGPFPILNYNPETAFSTFIGCPLNGPWTITVTDNLFIDDGYIFNWGIDFSPSILPVSWEYTPEYTSGKVWLPNPTIVSSSGNSITVAPTDTGFHYYTFRATDNLGCSYDTTVSVYVVAQPKVNLGNDTVICKGSVIYLDAGNNPSSTFQWNTGAPTQTVPVNVSGIYVVSVSNTHGTKVCTTTDTVTVLVIEIPDVYLGNDTCRTTPFTLDAGNPGSFYTWSTGDTTQNVLISMSGTYTVTVNMYPGSMCFKSDEIEVLIIPDPIVDLGSDFELCKHMSKKLSVQQLAGTGPYKYLWQPSGFSQPYFVVDNMPAGEALIKVTVEGCSPFSDSVTVTIINCDINLPNIITPNGDGFNDKLIINNLEYYPNSSIVVFNRWGKRVFESNNYQNDWDADGYADGVYYYVLKLKDGNDSEFNSSLTIMRN